MNIRIAFTDFWGDFNPSDNIWTWLLSQRHNVVLDNDNPNLVISMGMQRKYPNVFTIYHTNEPFFPNLNQLNDIGNYYLSNFINIDNIVENHTRFPSYYMYLLEFIRLNILDKELSLFHKENRTIPVKEEFCVFVSRGLNGKRGRFFEKLNQYKTIHTNVHNHFSLPFDNNQFNSSIPKMNFIKKYKFTIAFENNWRGGYPCWEGANVVNGELQDMNGLISEKLVEPLIAGTIPIYWGSEYVSKEFNNKTFINYYDYKSEDELIEKIIKLDNNDELYNSYFKEPISAHNSKALTLDYILDLMDNILVKI